jgi:hypothetical protein
LIGRAIDNAAQILLGFFAPPIITFPDGTRVDRRLVMWPPHRLRGTGRHRNGNSEARVARQLKKKADGLELGVVGGRLTFVSRRLRGWRGAP